MEAEKEAAEPREDKEAAQIAAEIADAQAKPAGAKPDRSAKAVVSGQIDDLFAAVRRLETFAADEAKRVSGKLLPQVEERAKKNLWFSLLLALGLGLILGIWITGGRRRE